MPSSNQHFFFFFNAICGEGKVEATYLHALSVSYKDILSLKYIDYNIKLTCTSYTLPHSL